MNRWAKKPPTAAEVRAQLVLYLYSCRDHMLAGVTVDDLVGRYRISRQVAEYELTIARQKRGVAA